MNKALIQTRFGRHLEDYNKHARIQKNMAQKLIRLCSKTQYESILEIGCGTGFLTKLAYESLVYKNYTAVDIVAGCEQYIKNINPDICFKCADIENFDSESYDLILSNAALQWTEDFFGILKTLKDSLNGNGEFIFTVFGREHFREIFRISGTTLQYPTEIELKEVLGDSISVTSEVIIIKFKTPKEVLKHLHLTGVNSVENKTWTKKDLRAFEHDYLNICGTEITLTYNPLYIKFQK